MALKTNFTDDILSESMNGKRQYNITENSNGTKSLEDVTDYQSVGSTFSAKNMNETNAAVNQAYDDIGDEFNPEVDYAVGDYTIRNNKIWKFTTAHPAGAWDESHVKATKILSEARELTGKIPNPVLLWENPDPTQRFPVDGTIELSSGDYEWLEIYYCSNTTSNGLLYQKVKKGDIPILIHTHFTSSGSGFGYRALQYVDDTHLKGTGYSVRQYFSNNVTPQFDNKATAYGIPVKIYGIK